jgi:PKD repeat protein
VDDSDPLTFSDAQADLGYNVVITAGDGFSKTVTSAAVKRNDNWIVANLRDGNPLPFFDGTKRVWPLKIVGSVPTSGQKVGNITRIELTGFVSPPEIPVAAFSASPLSGVAPLAVQFTDASTGTVPITYAWEFGDGTTSADPSPSHTYAAGTYNVRLTVTNSAGSDVEEKTGYITVTEAPVAPVAQFSGTPTSGTAPLSVQFTDASTGTGPLTYAWEFGDGGTSPDPSPSHTYDAAGTYAVKLTVTGPGGADDEVKADYITVTEAPSMDVLFDGQVTITPDATFTQVAYNSGASSTVEEDTPLGALHAAATAAGFTYDVTDKLGNGVLLLDNVDTYLRDKTNKIYWYAYVNDVYKDGYASPADALNLMQIQEGDRVEFYYAGGITDPTDLAGVKATAKAAVKTVASTGVVPTDWTLAVSGARTETVSKSFFESGLACPQSGHQTFWTDDDGNVWGGVPLWLLVGMADDNPDVGPDHFNFNDALAAQHYQVKVIGSDGWSAIFDSADIARSSDYLVANTLNGEPLPLRTPNDKPSWPLHLKGSSVLGGQQVGGIARIELLSIPEPPQGWTLAMLGEVGDTITQEEFENALACPQSGHLVEWTDKDGNVWSGVPLWLVLGTVDDIELADHWTFNDDVAAAGYTVKVTASDGFSKTFSGVTVARNNNYIIANKMNGQPLPETSFPLRLVGSGVTKPDGSLGGSAVGKLSLIEIPDLQTPLPAPGSYNLSVKGKITDMLSQAEIENGLACPTSGHYVEWTQVITKTDGTTETHVWSGFPLWFLAGWVDDRKPHDFNAVQAMAGYKITVKASDGYAKDFTSSEVAWSDDYIVATMKDGAPLATGWPLQLVGAPLTKADGSLGGKSVGKVAEIELTEFGVPVQIPTVHVVKYAADRTTVVDEATLDYTQMISQFDVIGDGTTMYKFQGVTMDPTDPWSPTDETKGGSKVSNAVKGTRLLDLTNVVGGMGEGTDLVLVASDGYKTILPYTSVHTTPAIQARQGDAILAWYADGAFVPGYADGMRLFFTPDDHIYGQWDMHETMPGGYWHYFYQTYDPPSPYAPGILYPSAAGLSAKYVTEIDVYTTPETQWNLQLDGTRVGGFAYTIAKTYFEQALACQFGANHEASYTDSTGAVWKGMPLWFLAGYVDDADQHSNTAYNRDLAAQGYNITVIGSGGFNAGFDSRLTIESTNYLMANTKNGVTLPETDTKNWPLKLVGTNATGKKSIGGVHTIILNFDPKIDSLIIPTDPVLTGVPVTASAAFTDPYDTHTAIFDWGDGTTSTGVVDEEARVVTGTHMYGEPGSYPVTLFLWDSLGIAAASPPGSVLVVMPPPTADFTATPTSGVAPLTVTFTDGSTGQGSLTYSWDFNGDGIIESSEQNPSFMYTTPGTYAATLTVTNEGGSSTKTVEITVLQPAPVAGFAVSSHLGRAPLSVRFTDRTQNSPTGYLWRFGDGGTSTEQSPTHTYNRAGIYIVNLQVTNDGGSDSSSNIVVVLPGGPAR